MTSLLDPWRDRFVQIASPLSPQEALHRIAVGIGGHQGRHIIKGRVTGDNVRLEAGTLTRNSWRPVLYARVEATPGGCRLIGTVGTPLVVKVFITLWLAAGAVVTIAVTAATLFGPAKREPSLFIPWAMLAFGLTLNYGAHALGRKDEQALLEWLNKRLG